MDGKAQPYFVLGMSFVNKKKIDEIKLRRWGIHRVPHRRLDVMFELLLDVDVKLSTQRLYISSIVAAGFVVTSKPKNPSSS